jgi:ABC-type amino acid transport substrate-binding protein
MKPRLYISAMLSLFLVVLAPIVTSGSAWADEGPVASSSSVEEPARVADFSLPVTSGHVAAPEDAEVSSAPYADPKPRPEFATVEDLKGKSVAVLNGSVLGDAVVEATGVDLEFKYFNQLADSIQALKGGKVSALVSDLPICKLLVAENPGLTILPEQAAKDDYGMIFAKSNPLRDDFSRVIDKLREDGIKAGMIKVRVFRPFPGEELAQALKDVKAAAILDRAESFSGQGGPLGSELKAALLDAESKAKVINYFYGLGGRDYTVENAQAVYEDLFKLAAGEATVKGLQYKYIGLRR